MTAVTLDSKLEIAVYGAGMVTAVGFNARTSCAAIRAGISGIQEDNIWDPAAGVFIGVGRPCTPQWWEGPDMLAELAAPAVDQCLKALPQGVDPGSVPVFLLLCSNGRPLRPLDLERIACDGLGHRLSREGKRRITAISQGRTGILAALKAAHQLFVSRAADYVVVAGVDTFLRQRVVEFYMGRRRILTADNSNGFIPGEAACAVLLGPYGQQDDGRLHIIGWGEGHEKATIDSDDPLTGDGLTQALDQALTMAGAKMADTHYWLTDQNAEHYKAKECTLAQIRLERREHPASKPYEIWHPIEYVGEIGSAIAPCLLGVAYMASKYHYAPGPLALMHVGADHGHRTAFVLQWLEGA